MFDVLESETPAPSDEDAGPVVLRTDARGCVDARATLDLLLDAQPGPDVLSVAALLSAHLPLLDATDRVDLLIVLERCSSWVEAVKQPVFAQLRRDAGERSGSDSRPGRFEDLSLELSAALRWSEWMVDDRMETGREIEDRLPDTWAALAAGRISYAQAHKIAEATRKLDDDAAAARLERRVLAKAPQQTRAETNRLVDRELIKADPEAAERRRKHARHGREVSRGRGEDGMAKLTMYGPVEDIAAIDVALSRGAELLKATGVVDTLDQGRFDTGLSWALDYLRNQFVPGRSARPSTVNVVAKKSTLDGDDDDPADLERWGPITASVARDLARGVPPRPGPFWPGLTREERDEMGRRRKELFPNDDRYAGDDADPPPPDPRADSGPPPGWDPDDWNPPDEWPPRWPPAPPDDDPGPPPNPSRDQGAAVTPTAETQPVVTFRLLTVDPVTGWLLPPDGVCVDFGYERAYLTGAARAFVLERFQVCEFPGCAMPARCCDADHWQQRAHGGRTDATTNCGPGCPHHNRTTRNRPGWTIDPSGDGTATLVTPRGRRYPIEPHNYLD